MENKITYQQYRKERQNSFNELPIFYAFSNEQFIEAMKQRGLDPEKDCDKLSKIKRTRKETKQCQQEDYLDLERTELIKQCTIITTAILMV